MKQKKLQTALIGCGNQMVSELLPALKSKPDLFEVVAACDPIPSNLTALNLPEILTFAEYHQLLSKLGPQLDLVVISVPHFLHFPIAAEALRQQVMVIKEKPLAATLPQAFALTTIAREHQTKLWVLTKRQYYPSYARLAEFLPLVGQVYQYTAIHTLPHGNIYQGWRSQPEQAGGGVLLDLGYHLLDILVSVFGKPDTVLFKGTNLGNPEYDYQVEDAASLMLKHPGSVIGSFQLACLSEPKQEELVIRGAAGTLTVTKNQVVLTQKGEKRVLLQEESDGIQATAQAMTEFCQGEVDQEKHLQHHLELISCINQAYQGGL